MQNNTQETLINFRQDLPERDDVMSRRRRKKRRSRIFSNILTVLAIIGMLIGGGILGSTIWEEHNRRQLTKEFTKVATERLQKRTPRTTFAPLIGEIVGLIIFPEHDHLTVPLVEGLREEDLYAGIGHDELTGWPTDQQQIFLAGHRNTEFGVLKDVMIGEEIIMDMPYGQFFYKIVEPPNDAISSENYNAGRIVHETQVEVIEDKEQSPPGTYSHDQLVLMTCYPFTFGASLDHRFLIYAERV